jgi:hypothetical protein
MAPRRERTHESLFEQTSPSELARAGGGDLEALDRLIRKYHTPLKVYFCFAFPSLRERAEELLQDFAQDRILREGWLAQVDLKRGRFRDFLKTSLRNFTLNWLRKHQRENQFESLDRETEERPGEQASGEQDRAASEAYDLEWLRAIVAETLRRMEEDCMRGDKQRSRRRECWEIFSLRVLQPALQDAAPPTYREVAARFSLRSPSEGANLLLTAKRIFERHLFEVVEEYQSRSGAARAEVEDLKKALLRMTGAK